MARKPSNGLFDSKTMTFLCYLKRKGRRALDERYADVRIGLATEKIAADLGYDLGLPVATGTLWQPYQDKPDTLCYLSMDPFSKSKNHGVFLEALDNVGEELYIPPDKRKHAEMPEPLDKETRQEIGRKLFQDIATQNTALWVFYRWIGDAGEHSRQKDNYLLSILDSPRRPILAGIDHGCAQFELERRTFINEGPFIPFNDICVYKIPPIDPAAGKDILERIQNYSLQKFQDIVFRIPDSLASPGKKQLMVEGLEKSTERLGGEITNILERFGKGGILQDQQYGKMSFFPKSPGLQL